MPRPDYRTCRNCHRPASEAGPLSHTRLCGQCGPIVQGANNDGLHEKSGPAFRRWRRAMAASVGGVLLDDVKADA